MYNQPQLKEPKDLGTERLVCKECGHTMIGYAGDDVCSDCAFPMLKKAREAASAAVGGPAALRKILGME